MTRENHDSRSRTGYTALFIAVLLAGALFRGYGLGHKVLWIDEGVSWRTTKLASVRQIAESNRGIQHTSFAQSVNFYWVRLFGDSVAALHSESLLWSLLCLGFFAAAALGALNRRAALGAAAALAFSAFVPEFAQMLRYPALASFLAAVWLFALFRYRKTGGAGPLLLYAAALAAYSYVHLYGLFTIFALTAFMLVRRRAFPRGIAPLIAANFAGAAVMIPKLLEISSAGVGEVAKQIPISEIIRHLARVPVGGIVNLFIDFIFGRAVPSGPGFHVLAGAALLVFAAIMFAALFSREHRFEAELCAAVLVITVGLGWFGMLARGIYFQSQYYLPVYLFFCLMLGIGADTILKIAGDRLPSLPKLAGIAGAAMLALYIAFSAACLHVYWRTLHRPENIKTIVRRIEAEARPGDVVVISPPYTFAFDYYWKGKLPVRDFSSDYDPTTPLQPSTLTLRKTRFDEARMERWARDVASHHRRVWMFWVLGYRNTEDRNAVARSWLDSHFRRIETHTYRMFTYDTEPAGVLVLYELRTQHKKTNNISE